MKTFNLEVYATKPSVVVGTYHLVYLCFSESKHASNPIMPGIWLSFLENNVTLNVIYCLFGSTKYVQLVIFYRLMISLAFEKL